MPPFNLACGQNVLRSLDDDLRCPRDFRGRPNGAWGAGRQSRPTGCSAKPESPNLRSAIETPFNLILEARL